MKLKAIFSENDRAFNLKFSEKNTSINTAFSEIYRVQETAEIYDGIYDVTPTVDGRTLPTANKRMRDDVRIKAIPYYETSNDSGGNTVYIADGTTASLGEAVLGLMKL